MGEVINLRQFKEKKGDKQMIKIQLLELQSITGGLNDISSKVIPVKASYWIGKLIKKLEKEIKDFEEARMKLVDQYGMKDKDGQLIIEKNQYVIEDKASFDKEFNELQSTEIEIDFPPIALSSFKDAEVTPGSMLVLDKFIAGDK